MIINRPDDVIHKAQLLKLLTGIADNAVLSQNLFFKGGTAASMLGYLDRFSVDLDFDLKIAAKQSEIKQSLLNLFDDYAFEIKNESEHALLYILKYDSPKSMRNTLKLSVIDEIVRANSYSSANLPEIDRTLTCQTIDTMFANKLIAPIDRYSKHKKIAGRDIYDIHHFFSKGYRFRSEIIKERSKTTVPDYLKKLIDFIDKNVTQDIINEDLNTLLPYDKFQKIRKNLKTETLILLRSTLTQNPL